MINIHSAAPSILRSPAALVVLDKPSLCLVVLDIRARVAKPWGFEDSVAGARLARLAEIVLAYLQVVETHVVGSRRIWARIFAERGIRSWYQYWPHAIK
jgi:hypothetical protein